MSKNGKRQNLSFPLGWTFWILNAPFYACFDWAFLHRVEGFEGKVDLKINSMDFFLCEWHLTNWVCGERQDWSTFAAGIVHHHCCLLPGLHLKYRFSVIYALRSLSTQSGVIKIILLAFVDNPVKSQPSEAPTMALSMEICSGRKNKSRWLAIHVYVSIHEPYMPGEVGIHGIRNCKQTRMCHHNFCQQVFTPITEGFAFLLKLSLSRSHSQWWLNSIGENPNNDHIYTFTVRSIWLWVYYQLNGLC